LFNDIKNKVMTKIENEIQYDWAVKRVEALLPLVDDDTPRDDPNSIELELLSNMVADYSEKHFALGEPSLADVIRLRMLEMDMTQKTLSELLEISPSCVSNYLTGKCEPTLPIARKMSKRLGISPSVILGV
jgi:HTH-type transcriptional regulator/antitoxin HigA